MRQNYFSMTNSRINSSIYIEYILGPGSITSWQNNVSHLNFLLNCSKLWWKGVISKDLDGSVSHFSDITFQIGPYFECFFARYKELYIFSIISRAITLLKILKTKSYTHLFLIHFLDSFSFEVLFSVENSIRTISSAFKGSLLQIMCSNVYRFTYRNSVFIKEEHEISSYFC